MRALLVLLLLGGCAGWPRGSYVAADNGHDAAQLAPVIAECVSYIVPYNSPVAVSAPGSSGQVLSKVLVTELERLSLTPKPDGRAVSYVVGPVEQGTLVSVASPPHGRCGQYMVRSTTHELTPGGSMMVAQ